MKKSTKYGIVIVIYLNISAFFGEWIIEKWPWLEHSWLWFPITILFIIVFGFPVIILFQKMSDEEKEDKEPDHKRLYGQSFKDYMNRYGPKK